MIKGCPMGVPDGSWSYAYFADSLNNYCKTIEGIHYAEMPYVMQINKRACILLQKDSNLSGGNLAAQ